MGAAQPSTSSARARPNASPTRETRASTPRRAAEPRHSRRRRAQRCWRPRLRGRDPVARSPRCARIGVRPAADPRPGSRAPTRTTTAPASSAAWCSAFGVAGRISQRSTPRMLSRSRASSSSQARCSGPRKSRGRTASPAVVLGVRGAGRFLVRRSPRAVQRELADRLEQPEAHLACPVVVRLSSRLRSTRSASNSKMPSAPMLVVGPHTAWAASSEHPPAENGQPRERRLADLWRAARSSRRSLRAACGGARACRAAPTAGRAGGPGAAETAAAGRKRVRAAASSIASGRPSRRTHTSATERALSAVSAKVGRTARARWTNRATLGLWASSSTSAALGMWMSVGSGGSGRGWDGELPLGAQAQRLATGRPGRARRGSCRRADRHRWRPRRTCSQLSRTSSRLRSPSARASASSGDCGFRASARTRGRSHPPPGRDRHWRQVDKAHAFGEVGFDSRGDGQREACLAYAAWPRQRQQAGALFEDQARESRPLRARARSTDVAIQADG